MFPKSEHRKPSLKGNRHRRLPFSCRPIYNQGVVT